MTLYSIIKHLETLAGKQKNVRTTIEGDVFQLNANPSTKYGVFCITQGQHSSDDGKFNYKFYLYYIDRLVDNLESNRAQIQSVGMQVLSNIINSLDEDIDVSTVTYQPFTQKFADECAGVYAEVTLTVYVDDCPEEYN